MNWELYISRDGDNLLSQAEGTASSCTDSSGQLELMPEDISNEHI